MGHMGNDDKLVPMAYQARLKFLRKKCYVKTHNMQMNSGKAIKSGKIK